MKFGTRITVGIIVVITCFLTFFQLDYYIMKPGKAYDVNDFITVQNGDQEAAGAFYMMTVSMGRATPITYMMAMLDNYMEVVEPESVRQEEEDEEEYNIRQLKMMTDSQFNAEYVAFSRANLDYQVTYKGVYVLNVLKDGAAANILKPGDEIVEIDGERIERQTFLMDRIAEKKLGDTIHLVVNRNDELLDKTVTLAEIPKTGGHIGLGITFTESKSIKTEPKVIVETEDIGGPSAGLMFTLELMNQLTDEDLTKGYQIAGTGEMYEDGTVGRIGGAERKVVAAHNDDMEIFFVPDDDISDAMLEINPNIVSNYEEAAQAAKDIETAMKIVPVKTIDDALDYLEKLPPKN